MLLPSEVLANVRSTLADLSSARWSDDRLYSLLTEAQKELAVRANLYKKKVSLLLIENVQSHTLPNDLNTILRITDDTTKLPIALYTHDELDEKTITWDNETGPVLKGLVYNLNNPDAISSYPILASTNNLVTFTFNSMYGVVGDSDILTFSDVYGVIAGSEVTDSVYGFTTELNYYGIVINIQYNAIPIVVNANTAAFVVPEEAEKALHKYVIGHALLDDTDTLDVKSSEVELALFGVELSSMFKNSSVNSAKPAYREVKYSCLD